MKFPHCLLMDALIQRLRRPELWDTCGVALAIWIAIGMVSNALWPVSGRAWFTSPWFTGPILIILFVPAFWTTFRGKSRITIAADGTAKTALIGALPDMLVCLLGIARLVNPVIIDPYRPFHPNERAIAFGFIRGTSDGPITSVLLLAMLVIEPCALSVIGLVVGGIGAALGYVLYRFTTMCGRSRVR